MNQTAGEKAALKGLIQWHKELMDKAREVKGIIVGLGGSVEDEAAEPSPETPNGSSHSDLGPQQVVENYLRDHRLSFRPRQLARRITLDGYTPTNPNVWPNQVANCLKRAVAKGLVEITRREDKKAWYGWKRDEESDNSSNQSLSEI
jgi:hypothetical protein